MIKKILNWFRSLFNKKFSDKLKNFTLKSSAKRGSEIKPEKLEIPRWKKACKQCGDPMFVSVGQIVYTHGDCRTLYRRLRFS
jgi:hypothetical protein